MPRDELRQNLDYSIECLYFATPEQLETFLSNQQVFERFGKVTREVLSAPDPLPDEVRIRFLEGCQALNALFTTEMEGGGTSVGTNLYCARRCLSEGIT